MVTQGVGSCPGRLANLAASLEPLVVVERFGDFIREFYQLLVVGFIQTLGSVQYLSHFLLESSG